MRAGKSKSCFHEVSLRADDDVFALSEGGDPAPSPRSNVISLSTNIRMKQTSEGFPLEGKLSAQQTDEVSAISNLQFFLSENIHFSLYQAYF